MISYTSRKATQVRIYRSSDFDFTVLASKPFIRLFVERLGMADGGTLDPIISGQPSLVLSQGFIESEKSAVIVDNLAIDVRRVVINVSGSTNDAELVYSTFTNAANELLAKIKMPPFPKPIVEVNEAVIGVKSKFKLSHFISPSLGVSFDKNMEEAFTTRHAGISVVPMALEYQVSYPQSDKILTDSRITLNSKQFSIKQVLGSEENEYLVSGPTSTTALAKLFKQLEKAAIAD